MLEKETCGVHDCDRSPRCRGWCERHYRRWLAHGDPVAGKAARGEPQEWIRRQVETRDRDGGCWEWPFHRTRCGYGDLRWRGRHTRAHRVALEIDGRPVPSHLMALHSCDNRGCVNPAHLRAGTHADNTQDMLDRQRQARGERASRSALTEDDVREIRRRHASDPAVSRSLLAAEFGCSPPAVSYVINRKTWAWLDA